MTNHNTSIRPSYDVIVVGARAAGASTAMLMARHGLSVLAVDRAAYGTDTLSTHSLAGAGVLQLSRWGLLDAIRAAGTPVANTVVFHYGDDEVTIDVPARGDVDGLYSPRRTLLDTVLSDAATDAGVDVRHGVSMVSVLRDPAGRVNGVELDTGGARLPVAARLVVGADGVRSRVARQVAAEIIHEERVGATSMFGYFDGLATDTIVNYYGTDRVAGVIPTNDGLACVWVGLPPVRFDREARGRVPEAHRDAVNSIPELANQLAGRRSVGGYRSFPGTPGFLKQAWGPGWALVGDAAYFKDPVSAHGITDAFIGAEMLAGAAAEMLQGGADEWAAMSRYQSARDEMAAQMMPPVATVASFPGDMHTVQKAFRGMSAAMRHELGMINSVFGAPVTV